jgi:hypothetical protein
MRVENDDRRRRCTFQHLQQRAQADRQALDILGLQITVAGQSRDDVVLFANLKAMS